MLAVTHHHRGLYIAVIAKDEPSGKAMPVSRTHTGKVPLSQLFKELENIQLAIEDAHATPQGHACNTFL
jgi:V/A-type H+-transporting ATPase subunit I